ncbi:MAG TPA: DinB family protein [Longimicrobiaceae bacterium]|nr:DinB family protein [Longimicrobiaceae bacterium]
MAYALDSATTSLATTGAAIRALVADLSTADARWKPAVDRWSILEVINHLVDEEVEDFRARLDVILLQPEEMEFAPIDPEGAVLERRYCDRTLEESVQRFAEEREKSLAWLRSLEFPDLERTKRHQWMGEMTGRQMLVSWVAHDLHHVRQITRLRYERLAQQAAPLTLAYAGEW